MRVKMTKTVPGSPDGVEIRQYEEGQEYEVTDDLGAVLVSEGFADKLKSKPEDTETRTVDVDVNDPGRGGFGITDPGAAENVEIRKLEDQQALEDSKPDDPKKASAPAENKQADAPAVNK